MCGGPVLYAFVILKQSYKCNDRNMYISDHLLGCHLWPIMHCLQIMTNFYLLSSCCDLKLTFVLFVYKCKMSLVCIKVHVSRSKRVNSSHQSFECKQSISEVWKTTNSFASKYFITLRPGHKSLLTMLLLITQWRPIYLLDKVCVYISLNWYFYNCILFLLCLCPSMNYVSIVKASQRWK